MDDSGGGGDKKTIGALETAFNIVELVAEHGELTPAELAEYLDYSRSTIHYYLTTLEKHRFLTRGNNGYQIGFRFLHYGNYAIKNHNLTGVVGPKVEKLARETKMTALFAVQQQGRSIFIYQSMSNQARDNEYYVGIERYLHCTAFGKALLAYLPEERLDTLITQHGLPEVSPGAVTDREDLLDELSQIREQEFAYQKGEANSQDHSIAAPIIRDPEQKTVGAIGIVGSSEEITDPGSHIKAQRFAEKPATIVKRYAQILRNDVT